MKTSSAEAAVTLTATQQRNARKRRAKQKLRQGGESSSSAASDLAAEGSEERGAKRRRLSKSATASADPSLRYIADPRQAPLVLAARNFFQNVPASKKAKRATSTTIAASIANNFPVFVGESTGWRTVAKLAVRNAVVNTVAAALKGKRSKQQPKQRQHQQLTIGLFQPGTHTVIPAVPEDIGDETFVSVHHPAIDKAIRIIQEQARRLGIEPYSEVTGLGQFRHVALAVQRHTQKVQCTLVWNNGSPASKVASGEKSMPHTKDEARLDTSETTIGADVHRLVRALVASSSSTTQSNSSVDWHSIWWHDNSSWKHDNAIFSHTGAWKLLHPSTTQSASDLGSTETAAATVVSRSSSVLSGGIEEYLSDCGNLVPVPLYFPPHVFRQGNLTAFTAIVKSIRAYLQDQYGFPTWATSTTTMQPQPRCLELYGGVGTIGLHVADLCSTFVSSDENPYNVACFEASAAALLQSLSKIPPWKSTATAITKKNKKHKAGAVGNVESTVTCLPLPTIRYQSASASKMIAMREHEGVDVIIVDPPRKGLEDSVSAALVAAPFTTTTGRNKWKNDNSRRPCRHQTLVYVSCGFDAFQRDYHILTTSSQRDHDGSCSQYPWKLDRAEGHILFPGSNAIETLAFFTRVNPLYTKDPSCEYR